MALVFPSTELTTIPDDREATTGRTVQGTEAQGVASACLHFAQYRFRRAVTAHVYTDLLSRSADTISPIGKSTPIRAAWRCSPRAEVVLVFVDLQTGLNSGFSGNPTLDIQLETFPGAVVIDAGYQLSNADGSLPNIIGGQRGASLWPQGLVTSGERRDAGAVFARLLEIPKADRDTVIAVRATPNDVGIVSLTAVEGFLPGVEQFF